MSMQEHINRGGYRYGVHIRNHMITEPKPYVRYEPTMMEVVAEVLAKLTLSVIVPLIVVAAAICTGV